MYQCGPYFTDEGNEAHKDQVGNLPKNTQAECERDWI